MISYHCDMTWIFSQWYISIETIWVETSLRSALIVAKFTTEFIVYGLSTLFMFISSLLFHFVDFKKSQDPNYYSFQFFKIIHVLERGAIYVCIAGNSHPWLQNINTEGAIYTSWFTWISAIFGLWFSYTFYERYKVEQFWFWKVQGRTILIL